MTVAEIPREEIGMPLNEERNHFPSKPADQVAGRFAHEFGSRANRSEEFLIVI
tara:strand:- start:4576 stop:4734 length:159 start_codon:yes stop_codon:yes gene_type:complete